MTPDDHHLLEQTRKANKTLSLFAFALQEEAPLSVRHQREIADVLATLAEAIRARAGDHVAERRATAEELPGTSKDAKLLPPAASDNDTQTEQ